MKIRNREARMAPCINEWPEGTSVPVCFLPYKLNPGTFSSEWLHLNRCTKVTQIKNFDLSLKWGFGLVSLFLLCKVFCSVQSWSLPVPGLEWSLRFPVSPSFCSWYLSLVSTGAPGPLFGVGVHAWGAPHARRGMSMASMVIAPLGSCTQTFPYPWLLIG